MHATKHDGVLFYEARPQLFEEIQRIDTELGGIVFSQAQLKTLRDVKTTMAYKAKELGGNAIIDFQYGQRSVGWWRSLLQMDDVNWYGSGVVAIIHVGDDT